MWYWLRKFEGLLVIPPFAAYYILRGISFFIRCRKCGRWLFDQQFLRDGICERCTREMVLSEPGEFYREEHIVVRSISPGQEHYDRRTAKRVGYGRILDVGCSYGRLLSRVAVQQELYGMDVSAGAISMARIRVKDGNFCLGDARSIPYKSNSFDYVICTEVLEHIEGNDPIRECYRVLKPNGVALITVPNGKGTSGKYFPYHIRLFSFSSLTGSLEEAGFEIISGQKFGIYIPFVTCLLGMTSLALGRNLPFCPILNIDVPEFLADHFFVECRKPSESE
jgi:SAM-dependent methyltransferase